MKLSTLLVLPLAVSSALAGSIQVNLDKTVSTFSMNFVMATSPFGQDPSNYCVFNKSYNAYFDVQHPPTPTQVSECSTMGNTLTIERAKIDQFNQLLTSMPTFTMPVLSITKINGVAAPASCSTLSNYKYTTNADYTIQISTKGCALLG